MKKILIGWGIITLTYMLYEISVGIYLNIFELGSYTDYNPNGLIFLMGLGLILIPYTIGGFYCKKYINYSSIVPSFLVAIIPNIGEKLLIYLIASKIYNINIRNGIVLINRISGSGGDPLVPHFTPIYIVSGLIISTLICIIIAKSGRFGEK